MYLLICSIYIAYIYTIYIYNISLNHKKFLIFNSFWPIEMTISYGSTLHVSVLPLVSGQFYATRRIKRIIIS